MLKIKETNLEFVRELSERDVTDLLVIHHVGGTNRDVSAAEIHDWHLANGWAGIGYHYVIRQDGTIERGRPKTAVGAHAQGCNYRSIGINVVGDFENFNPTPQQIKSVNRLVADLCNIYDLTPDDKTVVGHRDLMETDCPGQNLYDLMQDIRGNAIWYQQNGVDA